MATRTRRRTSTGNPSHHNQVTTTTITAIASTPRRSCQCPLLLFAQTALAEEDEEKDPSKSENENENENKKKVSKKKSRKKKSNQSNSSSNHNNNDNLPLEEMVSFESKIDWDAEWKKVKQQQQQQQNDQTQPRVERPGKNYYKSEAEIAAIRTANQATQQLNKVVSSLPSLSLKNKEKDWKFWLGALLVVCFGVSLLNAVVLQSSIVVTPTDSLSSSDSYFI